MKAYRHLPKDYMNSLYLPIQSFRYWLKNLDFEALREMLINSEEVNCSL